MNLELQSFPLYPPEVSGISEATATLSLKTIGTIIYR
jgi:hypothetical protein